jgi:hypothetical protein
LVVVQNFCEYKQWLVREIGFDDMLSLPNISKLNLKFSSWRMSKVNTTSRAVEIFDTKVFKFSVGDVYKVFCIPAGNRDVRGRDTNITPQAIEFIKAALGMNNAGVHSLRAAVDFLQRDLTEESSKLEKDCFKMAFVIFVMGHLLAPTTKHDHATIDFWGALADTDIISSFNWCEYVLEALTDAVRKIKKDMAQNSRNTHLVGCHLFLQVHRWLHFLSCTFCYPHMYAI